jgi:hypothetical protein
MFSERIGAVIDRVDRLRTQVDDHWQIPRDEALVLAQPHALSEFTSCSLPVGNGCELTVRVGPGALSS